MAELLRRVQPIAKTQRNQQQGYSFRGIDQVMTEIHPHLAELGLYLTTTVKSVEYQEIPRGTRQPFCRCTLVLTVTVNAEDGSAVSSQAVGEGMDTADKASNKAMSAAYKYSLFQMLCIPTEVVDGDRETFGAEAEKNGRREPPSKQQRMIAKVEACRTLDELVVLDGNAYRAVQDGKLETDDYSVLTFALATRLRQLGGSVEEYEAQLKQRGYTCGAAKART